jgi:uncharacterized protein
VSSPDGVSWRSRPAGDAFYGVGGDAATTLAVGVNGTIERRGTDGAWTAVASVPGRRELRPGRPQLDPLISAACRSPMPSSSCSPRSGRTAAPCPQPCGWPRYPTAWACGPPAGSGKVKRIRRDGTVTLAVCDRRGNPTGPPVDGTARVLDAEGTARVRAAVRQKYGLLGKALTTISQLRRGAAGAVGIAIEVR